MGVKLSPKYGVNPTIPICFWCGEERGEVALMGHIGNARRHEDVEAPMHVVIDYEPCAKCKEHMALGFTIMEATTAPNSSTSVPIQKGFYPTGRYVVVKPEAAERVFQGVDTSMKKALVNTYTFRRMFADG